MDALERLAARLVLEDSLLDFTKYFFQKRNGSRFIVNSHHHRIIEALEQVVNGTLPDGSRNLIINMPPRYGKTELAVINFIAWCMARNPRAKFIHLSYADKLALDNSSQVRELMKHEAFSELWQIEWKQDADAKGLWKTTLGGGLMASPAGGTITGFGAGSTDEGCFGKTFAGAIIIDDPLKPDDADSDTERENVNERLINTIMSRRNMPRETPIILIMQRLHEEDMTGFVLEGKTGEKWHHLKLAALSEEGEALWPHKHTVDELQRMQITAPTMFAGQMQQEPAPLEGVFFKQEMFEFYDELPAHVRKYGASDYAVSDGEGDYTVHGVLAVDTKDDWYLCDLWRKQAGSDVWVEQMLKMATQHQVVAWAEEKGQIIKSLSPYIKKTMMKTDQYVNRVQFNSSKDKPTRARASQARMATRKLYLPRNALWAQEFKRELLLFPKGKYDDQVDVISLFGRMLMGMTAPEEPANDNLSQARTLPTFEEMRQRNISRLRNND